MRAPAGFATVDRIQFCLSLFRRPQRAKVVVVISERAELFPEFARAHVAVVINHGNRFTGRAWERPRRRAIEVCTLGAIVSGDRADVSDVLGETLWAIVIRKHAIPVALSQLRHIRIHRRQRTGWHLLDLIADQRLAAHYVEVLAVELKILPHELAEFFYLPVVVGAYDRVGI